MQDRESTIRSRQLGEALRAAMTRAGLDGTTTARKLGWSPSKVSRLLCGTRGCTELDVVAVMAVCGVVGEERERLLSLAREVDLRGWFQQHGSRLPKQLRTLVEHEDKAVTVSDFQETMVPGLLQTSDYARTLIESSGRFPSSEVDERVEARLARQSLLARPRPARFTFFVHEFVLRLPVGSSVVMSDQLHHLLRVLVRPHVTLRVVPVSAGAHPAIAGHFKLMDFAEFRSVVYLDSATSTLFLEEPVEIEAYREILSDLEATALDEGQSRELIAGLATELYADGDDDDEDGWAGPRLA